MVRPLIAAQRSKRCEAEGVGSQLPRLRVVHSRQAHSSKSASHDQVEREVRRVADGIAREHMHQGVLCGIQENAGFAESLGGGGCISAITDVAAESRMSVRLSPRSL